MKFLIVKIPENVFIDKSKGSVYANILNLVTFHLKPGFSRIFSNLISYYSKGDLSNKVAVYCINTSHFKGGVDLSFIISNLDSVLGQTLIEYALTDDVKGWLSDREIMPLPVEHVGRF